MVHPPLMELVQVLPAEFFLLEFLLPAVLFLAAQKFLRFQFPAQVLKEYL